MEDSIRSRAYWDSVYSSELGSYLEHQQDPEDWFALAKGLQQWIVQAAKGEIHSVLDVGAGAGNFLFEMARVLPGANYVGVDYSLQAVQLAQEIAEQEHPEVQVEFVQADVTVGIQQALGGRRFALVNDKGTLDVIYLNGSDKVVAYFEQLDLVLHEQGMLCITSCNHTQDELVRLCQSKGYKLVAERKYPVFQYGGQTGSHIATVLFKRAN
jgi:SAM-dependent methyltransferase